MSVPDLLTGLGATFSVLLAGIGSSYACSHAGLFAQHFNFGRQGFLPLAMTGVLSVYGIVISVLLCGKMEHGEDYPLTESQGYKYLFSGVTVGVACLCSGWGMGHFLKSQTPRSATARSRSIGEGAAEPFLPSSSRHDLPPPEYLSMSKIVIVLVFLELIGVYGLVISLMLMKQT